MEPALFTIGHSTRPVERFIEILRGHRVTLLVDVRTIPRSRHNPQFNQDTLSQALSNAGIRYRHGKDLGGLRHPARKSVNGAWRNKSFRGYADHMGTAAFARALDEVIEQARGGERLAMMCAEGAPFRCHRSLIADAVVARGLSIAELTSPTQALAHKLTPFARVEDGQVTYPANGPQRPLPLGPS